MTLPESWAETTVGKVIVDIQPGFAQKPGEDDVGMTPQIRTHNISPDGKIALDGIKHVSASTKELERYVLKKGDVVFNNTNSEEWVGKTAVFDQDGEYVFSNHMTRLRVDRDLALPEYIAGYLHLLWAIGYSKTRAKRWVSQAGIDTATLANFKLPLPPLPEQQRIVDVVTRADDVAIAKRSISDLIDGVIRSAYWQHFSDWYTADGLRDPVRIADYLADSQYGVSEAMEERGSHTILRMNSLTTSGWLDLSDLKYANLSKKDADNTQLRSGDLIFNRTNSKELVGKCAIWRESPGLFSFASYLVRLRLRPGMLPEYLWATLNSTYGKYRLMSAAKQAVSMANVSPTDLGRIAVPLPLLELQEKFAQFVRQVEGLRANMLEKLEAFEALRSAVAQQALIGELTATWRDQHRSEIATAARTRDALLRERGARLIRTTEAPPVAPIEKVAKPQSRPWLHGELSDFQRALLNAFLAYKVQPLLAEVEEKFEAFRATLAESLAAASPDQLRRVLSQLAALGLIAKVSVSRTNPDTRDTSYFTAFRPLRPSDRSRAVDTTTFLKMLGKTPQDESDQ